MLPNPYGLESLIAERSSELLRVAERERLARHARPSRVSALRTTPRARLAEALRSIADRLEPMPARVLDAERSCAA